MGSEKVLENFPWGSCKVLDFFVSKRVGTLPSTSTSAVEREHGAYWLVCVSVCSGKLDGELLTEVNLLKNKERLLYWSQVHVLCHCCFLYIFLLLLSLYYTVHCGSIAVHLSICLSHTLLNTAVVALAHLSNDTVQFTAFCLQWRLHCVSE